MKNPRNRIVRAVDGDGEDGLQTLDSGCLVEEPDEEAAPFPHTLVDGDVLGEEWRKVPPPVIEALLSLRDN